MIESFAVIIGTSLLVGVLLLIDTKIFLPKRTKAYLDVMKDVNEVKSK